MRLVCALTQNTFSHDDSIHGWHAASSHEFASQGEFFTPSRRYLIPGPQLLWIQWVIGVLARSIGIFFNLARGIGRCGLLDDRGDSSQVRLHNAQSIEKLGR